MRLKLILNIIVMPVIITLVLISSARNTSAIIELNQSIIDSIFTSLVVNDKRGYAEFTFYSPVTIAIADASKLTAVFNTTCGNVNSFKILMRQNKTLIRDAYNLTTICNNATIYANSSDMYKVIFDNDTSIVGIGTEMQCYNVSSFIGTEDYSIIDFFNITTIPAGNNTFRIVSDLRLESCNNSWGYNIDWKPMITLKKVDYIQNKWAWWSASYNMRRFIDCSKTTNGTQIVVGNSSGFFVSNCRQTVWTRCEPELYLYFNNDTCTDWTIANATAIVPFEVEIGNVSSNAPTAVWDSKYVGVYHMTNLLDSTAQSNDLVNTGADQIANSSCNIGGCYFFNSAEHDNMLTERNSGISGVIKRTIMALAKPVWPIGQVAHVIGLGAYSGTLGTRFAFGTWNSPAAWAYSSVGSTGKDYVTNYPYTAGKYEWGIVQWNGTMVEGWFNETFHWNATQSSGFVATSVAPLRISGWTTPEVEWWNGTVDEVRIINNTVVTEAYANETWQNFKGTIGYGTLGDIEGQPVPRIFSPEMNTSSTIGVGDGVLINVSVTDENGNTTVSTVWGSFQYPNMSRLNQTFTNIQYAVSALSVDNESVGIQMNLTIPGNRTIMMDGAEGWTPTTDCAFPAGYWDVCVAGAGGDLFASTALKIAGSYGIEVDPTNVQKQLTKLIDGTGCTDVIISWNWAQDNIDAGEIGTMYIDGTAVQTITSADPSTDDAWEYNVQSVDAVSTIDSSINLTFIANAGTADETYHLDNITILCDRENFIQKTSVFNQTYTNVMTQPVSNVSYINITVEVSVFNNSGSVANGANTNPDLAIWVKNDTDTWISIGNISISAANTNYTISTLDEGIRNYYNSNSELTFRIGGVNFDRPSALILDTINWTGVWGHVVGITRSVYYQFEWTDTSAAGMYNLTNIYANDTSGGFNSSNPSLTWTVGSGVSVPNQVDILEPINNTYKNVNSMFINISALYGAAGDIVYGIYTDTDNPPTTLKQNTTDSYYNYTEIADGRYFIKTVVSNGSSATNATAEIKTYVIDTTYPVYLYNATTNLNNTHLQAGSFIIAGTLTEANFANITYWLYDSTWAVLNETISSIATDLSFNFSTLPNGRYFYKVSVTDLAGNTNSTRNNTFVLDTVSPVYLYNDTTLVNNSYTNSSSFIIAGSITEVNLANITFFLFDSARAQLNATTFTTAQLDINFTALADGRYFYNVRVTDFAGNINSTRNNTFVLDTTYPQPTWANPTVNNTRGIANELTVNVSFTETNPSNCLLDWDGVNESMILRTTSCYITKGSLTDGTSYNFKVYVNDSVGHVNYTEKLTWFENTMPTPVDITAPVNNTYKNVNSMFINITTGTDAEGDDLYYGIYSDTDNPPTTLKQNTTATYYNFTEITDGRYFIKAVIGDGYEDNDTDLVITYVIDTTYPVYLYNATTNLNNTHLQAGSFIVAGALTEANFANITYYVYNETGPVEINKTISTTSTDMSFNFSTLPNGRYFYKVSVTDIAGNTNATRNNTFVLDTVAPVYMYNATVYSNNTYVSAGSFFISGTLTEVNLANITYRLWDSSWALINTTVITTARLDVNFTTLADGRYFYNVRTNDFAGNINSTRNQTLVLDDTKPMYLYNATTYANNTYLRAGSFIIAGTITETNFANITYWLYDSTWAVLNETISSTATDLSFNFSTLPNGRYFYKVSVTDLAGNTNATINQTFYLDTISPITTNLDANDTSPHHDDYVEFTVSWSDAGYLSSCIFSWNNSGDWVNDTGYACPGSSNTSYVVKQITAAKGTAVSYRWYANDSANNWNLSDIAYVTVINTYPTASVNISSNDKENKTHSNLTCGWEFSDLVDADTESSHEIRWFNFTNRSLCYQEFSNQSTTCGGLASGSYGVINATFIPDAYKIIDGDWNTAVGYYNNESYGILLINYTKPSAALIEGSLWRVKYTNNSIDINANYSIPSSCWASPLQLRILHRDYDTPTSQSYEQIGECYTSSSTWDRIWYGNDSGLPYGMVYEEAMIWNMSEMFYEQTEDRNATWLNQLNTTKGEQWYCSGRVNDGENWSVWSNSSIMTILNALPVVSVNISSNDGKNRSSSNLTCGWAFISDADGDALASTEIRWFNNSLEVTSLKNSTFATSGNFSPANEIFCSVRGNDGQDWSNWVNSSTMTIYIPTTISFSLTLPAGNLTNSSEITGIQCAQEFANQSTACGGVDTGDYSYINYSDAFYNTDNWNDGELDTCTNLTGVGSADFFINYTIPHGALFSSIWQLKTGTGSTTRTTNITLPPTCLNGSKLQLYFSMCQVPMTCSGIYLYCFNNSPITISFADISTDDRIYEEAMIWNITNYGNPTVDLDFNATDINDKYVDACAQGLGCQDDVTPIFTITNTGNENISWKMNVNDSTPSAIVLMWSNDNAPGGDVVLTTANSTVVAALTPGDISEVWLWANFTNAQLTDRVDRKLYNLGES